MPNLFPGVDTWAANIRTPADAEAVNAAVTDLAGSDAADRTLWTRNRIPGLIAAGEMFQMPLIAQWSSFDAVAGAPVWALDANTNWAQQSDNTFVNLTFFCLPRWKGAKLSSVALSVIGAGGHGGMPGTMPTFTLFEKTGFAAPTILASATDPSLNVGTYQIGHNISLTPGAAVDMGGPRTLYFGVNGEGGANFVAGYAVFLIIASVQPI